MERNYLICRQIMLGNYLRGLLMIDEVEASVPMLSFLGGIFNPYFFLLA